MTETTAQNPFFTPWTTPFGAPPFAEIAADHYRPAFDRALAAHRAEIAAIADNPAPPDFANTIDALESSGRALDDVGAVFFNLAATDSDATLQAIQREMAPILARHRNEISMNDALFRRVDSLHRQRGTLGLSAEQERVLDRYHIGFVRAGAGLSPEDKARLGTITEQLATLGTRFTQNLLADEQDFVLVLETGEDLAGLPDFVREAASQTARERKLEGRHAITLARSSIEPFLQFSERRDLREKAWRAWIGRGDNDGETDNKAVASEMIALRRERARLLGFPSFAHFRLDDTMAGTPDAVRGLLEQVWERARTFAGRDRDRLQALITEEGGNFALEPWDWRYYAEKLRKQEHDLDEAEVKPYLQLDRMIEAAFHTANRLFGLTFAPAEAPVWNQDVRAFEVTDADGRHIGLFYADYFARPSKRSGAWMTSFRQQKRLGEEIRPIVVNVMNFGRGAEGQPVLLSFDDARTLFHEFGHALHGLMSDVAYPRLSGTNVSRDFVELPSQLFEHWLETPEVLGRFAVHWRTGEPMPPALVERLLKARNFDQGCATVEYTASALLDLDLHQSETDEPIDLRGFEKAALDRIGMPPGIAMRHRLPHFAHVFSGDGYSSAYYSYMWSEVLDADAFEAFVEKGDPFDPETADRLRRFIYTAGNLRDPAEAYRSFRGKVPGPEALLRKRGFAPAGG